MAWNTVKATFIVNAEQTSCASFSFVQNTVSVKTHGKHNSYTELYVVCWGRVLCSWEVCGRHHLRFRMSLSQHIHRKMTSRASQLYPIPLRNGKMVISCW